MSTQRGLNFGPRSATAPAAASRPTRRAVGVRRFVAHLKTGLAELFARRFWLEGEVSGYRVVRGHAYFALKEDGEQVDAVIWARDRQRLTFTPEDGSQVLAQVRKVDFYGPSGRLSLHVDALEPHGVGALQKALEERRERLRAEGLFDESRKRPLPLLPRVVGIATAPGSAALEDVLEILEQRFAERRVLIRPCRVQGQGAAEDIAAAIDDLNRDGSPDVIIVGRGGGSMEDLWCFNEEAVVRAIARSRIPVIAGIGHEIDTTLADVAADLRCATPTAAAQRCLPDRGELEARLAAAAERLTGGMENRLELTRARLRACDAVLADPRKIVSERRLRLDGLGARAREALRALTPLRRTEIDALATRARRTLVDLTPDRRRRLDRATAALRAREPRTDLHRSGLEQLGRRLESSMQATVERARSGLAERASHVNALSPLAVLSRGFSVARTGAGEIVRDAAALSVGDELRVTFARGAATTRVEEVDPAADAMKPASAQDREEES